MSRGDIIRMAREAHLALLQKGKAGWLWHDEATSAEIKEFCTCFAALVAAYIRENEFKPDWNNYRQGLVDGAAAEREAIAKMFDGKVWAYDYREIAAAIRARGGE